MNLLMPPGIELESPGIIIKKIINLWGSLCLCLSVLTAIFQVNLGKPVFIEAKDDGSGGNNWSYKVVQSSSQVVTTHKPLPSFYRPDALPVAQPTVSKRWKEKYHIPCTCLPKLTWGSSNFVWMTNKKWMFSLSEWILSFIDCDV